MCYCLVFVLVGNILHSELVKYVKFDFCVNVLVVQTQDWFDLRDCRGRPRGFDSPYRNESHGERWRSKGWTMARVKEHVTDIV